MGERLKNYLKTMERMLEELERQEKNADCESTKGVQDGISIHITGTVQNGQNMHATGTVQDEKNVHATEAVQNEQNVQGTELRRAQLQRAKDELLVQIGFFQHERLIHLIVTVLFALLAMIVLIWVNVDFMPESALLLLLLLVLLIPYIQHYYILENGTQKLYQYYDRLEALLGKIVSQGEV